MSNDISTIGARAAPVASVVAPAFASAQAKLMPVEPEARPVKGMSSDTRAHAGGKTALEPQASLASQAPPALSAVDAAHKADQQEVMDNLHEAIEKLNEQAAKNGRGLNFSVDEELNRHIITVSNTQTGEVVRQIPTEVAIKVAHSIEGIKGLLLDEQS